MSLNYMANLGRLLPELVTTVTLLSIMLMEATYSDKEKKRTWVAITTLVGLLLAIVMALSNLTVPGSTLFTNSLIFDSFGSSVKVIMLLGGMGSIYMCITSKDIYENFKSEFLILMLGVIIGGMLLASANNMLTFYLGIETLSILSYVMATLKKHNTKSNEAGLKYALYGGVAAGVMLFGMAHLYGVLGTIDFIQMGEKIKNISISDKVILIPAFILFFAGIAFKIAAAPFHMWAPDVYEGSPLPVTNFFGIVPKIAGIAGLLRITMAFFSQEGDLHNFWVHLLQVVAVVTMFVGNISALNQNSVKRMLAYSGIGHAGIMMLGVIVMNETGARAILFYGLAYLFMLLTAFYVLNVIVNHYDNDHFDRFKGLIYRYPLMSLALILVMFSLAGIPPFSGFIAKFHIISAAINKGYYFISIVAVINSVISLFYYLKIVRLMVLRKAESDDVIPQGNSIVYNINLIGMSLPVILLGLCWGPAMRIISLGTFFGH